MVRKPHVVTLPPAPIEVAGGRARLHVVLAWEDNLVWLLECTSTGTVYAVDGPELAPVLAACTSLGLRLDGVLTTHTHPDHIGLHRELVTAAHEGMGSASFDIVGFARPKDPIPGRNRVVVGGDVVRVGALELEVIETPGHQDGHVSYVLRVREGERGAVFCGDTLFAAGCGRMFDGPASAMFASLHKLAALPADTLVCCAHEYTLDNLAFAIWVDPENETLRARAEAVKALRAEGRTAVPSTIGEELATNPFLRASAPEVARRVAELGGVSTIGAPAMDPADPVAAFAATRALKDRRGYPAL
jgi:hydroxyacylglutathione hydrolase